MVQLSFNFVDLSVLTCIIFVVSYVYCWVDYLDWVETCIYNSPNVYGVYMHGIVTTVLLDVQQYVLSFSVFAFSTWAFTLLNAFRLSRFLVLAVLFTLYVGIIFDRS